MENVENVEIVDTLEEPAKVSSKKEKALPAETEAKIFGLLSSELKIGRGQVEKTIALIDDGNTIPFIARYRKEATGGLDDVQLRGLDERLAYLRSLEQRKSKVLELIDGLGQLTDEISKAVEKAAALSELEDIYRPFRPKKKTRASVAQERGLLPLAEFLLDSDKNADIMSEAAKYIDEEKGVKTAEAALAGASDIIAEAVSDDTAVRTRLHELYYRAGEIVSTAADKKKDSVYSGYYDYSEKVNRVLGHRVLAIDRGEREGFLKVGIKVAEDAALECIYKNFSRANNGLDIVCSAVQDGYTRLIHPSMERRVRGELTEKAQSGAMKVFSQNLRQLLMQPPVKNAVTLGFDPGYRTGCKIAVVDGTGKVLDTGVVYPTPPKSDIAGAKKKITDFIKKHGVTVFAVGNGTASHESEVFVAELIKELAAEDSGVKLSYMMVSEAGASVYSASPLAAEEFPEYDVSLRSAVSIARRLQDPLAELVKIDPKAIGVGQYQHDMPPAELSAHLSGVVEDCVNSVGVDVNTASPSLLKFIAGVNAGIAKNIVEWRSENGVFTNRKQLLSVKKLGKKAYEQCAGFLRITDGDNKLDNTAVHPESYAFVQKYLDICGGGISHIGDSISHTKEEIQKIAQKIAVEIGVGVPTLTDIIKELEKPGRDPRDELPQPLLRTDVLDINSLSAGMELEGTVRNVIDFGAFVDIGVHQDGLVHVSQLANRRVAHPLDVVKVGDIVKVRVLSVDTEKKRISLTMKM